MEVRADLTGAAAISAGKHPAAAATLACPIPPHLLPSGLMSIASAFGACRPALRQHAGGGAGYVAAVAAAGVVRTRGPWPGQMLPLNLLWGCSPSGPRSATVAVSACAWCA